MEMTIKIGGYPIRLFAPNKRLITAGLRTG